jgi:hypothetical protein
MASASPNFADHLRSRCEEIGLQVLAEALDRLEAPWEGDVSEQATQQVDDSSAPHACHFPGKAAA